MLHKFELSPNPPQKSQYMKILPFVSLLFALGGCTILSQPTKNANRIDLDKVSVFHQYRNLPETPLDSSWRTYALRMEIPSTISYSVSLASIDERIHLEGWKKIVGPSYNTPQKAHLQISIVFDDLMFDNQKIEQRKEETRNKEGVITSSRSFFWSLVYYSLSAGYSILDYQGNRLWYRNNLGGSSSKLEWKSPIFNSYSEADRYFNNNRMAISNKLVKERMDGILLDMNNEINRKYGFPIASEPIILWTTDSKKHPENIRFNENMSKIKKAISRVGAKGIDSLTHSALTTAIAYFTDLQEEYASDEKGNRKLRYACCYNTAILFMILDMPTEAISACNSLIENDFDIIDGEKMIEKITALQELMAKNKIRSRHYPIDTHKFSFPQ